MYCGCKMNWEVTLGLPYAISLQHQSKPQQPLSLQFVCNQGNHSVVKTTNLFLQCGSFNYKCSDPAAVIYEMQACSIKKSIPGLQSGKYRFCTQHGTGDLKGVVICFLPCFKVGQTFLVVYNHWTELVNSTKNHSLCHPVRTLLPLVIQMSLGMSLADYTYRLDNVVYSRLKMQVHNSLI